MKRRARLQISSTSIVSYEAATDDEPGTLVVRIEGSSAFGIVMIRTDGNRLLVYTNSGQTKLKEAYAYCINDWGKPEPIEVRQV